MYFVWLGGRFTHFHPAGERLLESPKSSLVCVCSFVEEKLLGRPQLLVHFSHLSGPSIVDGMDRKFDRFEVHESEERQLITNGFDRYVLAWWKGCNSASRWEVVLPLKELPQLPHRGRLYMTKSDKEETMKRFYGVKARERQLNNEERRKKENIVLVIGVSCVLPAISFTSKPERRIQSSTFTYQPVLGVRLTKLRKTHRDKFVKSSWNSFKKV
jgi:hypothetical protein